MGATGPTGPLQAWREQFAAVAVPERERCEMRISRCAENERNAEALYSYPQGDVLAEQVEDAQFLHNLRDHVAHTHDLGDVLATLHSDDDDHGLEVDDHGLELVEAIKSTDEL